MAGIHAPKKITPRLRAILKALQSAGRYGLSGRDIIHQANVTGLEGVRELRALGFNIRCEKVRTTASGRKIFRYTLYENAL